MKIEVVREPVGSPSAGWEVVDGVLVVVADPLLSTGEVASIVTVARHAVEAAGQRAER